VFSFDVTYASSVDSVASFDFLFTERFVTNRLGVKFLKDDK